MAWGGALGRRPGPEALLAEAAAAKGELARHLGITLTHVAASFVVPSALGRIDNLPERLPRRMLPQDFSSPASGGRAWDASFRAGAVCKAIVNATRKRVRDPPLPRLTHI